VLFFFFYQRGGRFFSHGCEGFFPRRAPRLFQFPPSRDFLWAGCTYSPLSLIPHSSLNFSPLLKNRACQGHSFPKTNNHRPPLFSLSFPPHPTGLFGSFFPGPPFSLYLGPRLYLPRGNHFFARFVFFVSFFKPPCPPARRGAFFLNSSPKTPAAPGQSSGPPLVNLFPPYWHPPPSLTRPPPPRPKKPVPPPAALEQDPPPPRASAPPPFPVLFFFGPPLRAQPPAVFFSAVFPRSPHPGCLSFN